MSYFPEGLGTLPEGLGKSTAGALGMRRSSTGVTQLIWAFSRSTARAWPSQNGNRGLLHCLPLDIRLFSVLFHVSDWSDCTVLSHPPLVCFPSWHRGKCHGVHCLCECSWNGCMLMFGSCMEGLITLSLKLRVCCWLQHFLFGCFLSHFPIFFFWRDSTLGFIVFTWEFLLSPNHLAVSHQAVWHTEGYSEVPPFFFPTFKVSPKTLPISGVTPTSSSFSSPYGQLDLFWWPFFSV